MASATKVFKVRRRLKLKKMGRKRKNLTAKNGSTPSKAVLFGDEKSA